MILPEAEYEIRACMIIVGELEPGAPAGEAAGRALLAQRERCSSCMLDIANRRLEAKITCCTAGCEVFAYARAAREEECQHIDEDIAIDPCKNCPARGGWNPTYREKTSPECSGTSSDKYQQLT